MTIDIAIEAIANGYLVHVSGLDKPFCYHTMGSVQQALPNLIQMAVNAETLAEFKTQQAARPIGDPGKPGCVFIIGEQRDYGDETTAG